MVKKSQVMILVLISMCAMAAAQVDARSEDPFRNLKARPSQALQFLTSGMGRKMASHFPALAGYLRGMGINVPSAARGGVASWVAPSLSPVRQSRIPCNAAAGALFNLEPAGGSPEIGFNVPQIAASLDYVPHGGLFGSDVVIEAGDDFRGIMDSYLNVGDSDYEFDQVPNAWGYTTSGYYVHRQGGDCSPSFEGALPRIRHPQTQDILYGYSPTVSVDTTRGLFYAVDVRYSPGINGLGLFGTTLSRINDPNSCPDGTHLTDPKGANATATKCWPAAVLLNPQLNISPSTFSDKPYVKADRRGAGPGAGDVYVSWTNFDLFNGVSHIQFLVCPAHNFASPSACSSPMTISGTDPNTQYSQIAIRPDGIVSITYINVEFIETDTPPYERQVFDIKHVSCTPRGAPTPPNCSAPTLLLTETQPMPFPQGGPVADPLNFPAATFPIHDYRINGNTAEEFVTWGRCKVDPYYSVGIAPFMYCFQPQVVASWSVTDSSGNPLSWSAPFAIDSGPSRQVMPALQADRSRGTVEVIYLSSSADYYNERYQVVRTEIPTASYTPTAASNLTSVPIEPNADPLLRPFVGEILGFAANDGRAYVSFTGQAYDEIFGQNSVRGANNLVIGFPY